ncbi:MAG: hypothetical protein UX31_C0016G0021 [Candidatus Nomurabacteria bacterium GW2011_GWA1_46_11]|uniref:DUF1059 domain-containing protein n=1 Tax=Candidatus Nomurabacteria bacterium GW2011_GWA1_46_11 TaxID=1618732 RepID=A0A0G1NLS2_9BACT|nr:MAG: hypothetical protein UW69_C0012G0021 [Microgenomates group bacterium GW2011_GWA2_44_7]KKT77371.1 MAG: hypothetical protein UW73_C0021G0004 [Microgenomates group bacterium GW2011_GWB1_44_8]KKU21544.1 MAG: hypothetical protein UX31_C0016G0021 [Candidatus Nomurabacteria bacterium GW2011_GWA1_46_11]
MKSFQATCEDGWKSKVVKAKSIDEAANMLEADLTDHVKMMHNMDLPSDPKELHKSVVDHLQEVK